VNKNYIYIFLLLLCPSILFAIDSFEETAGTGFVINTNPPGVRIFIDGIERGRTPASFTNFPQGEYHIKLSRDGYRDKNFITTLFNSSRIVASITMEEERGFVQVNVIRDPDSPEWLLLNPQIVSDETSSFEDNTLNLSAGLRTIRVRSFGWEETSVSVLVTDGESKTIDIIMKPAQFKIGNASLSRRRFNPLNPGKLGETDLYFEVTSPGTAEITITNSGGEEIFNRVLGVFDTWLQHITWNGRDSGGNPLPKGVYTVSIKSDLAQEDVLKLEAHINYSSNIIPLSLDSNISGLIYTPMPHVLPPGSYQFDAGILIGRCPPGFPEDFGFPFKINMRISPVNRLELTTSFNINPYLKNQTLFTVWGISGSAKFNIFNNDIISFAAGISYSWMSETYPDRGIGFYSPFSLELSNFSIILCPAFFWHGPEGLTPSLLLGAGVLYKGSRINTGISARCELDFRKNNLDLKFLAGAEAHFFPPPSNLFFSLIAGVWTQGHRTGGYGGIRIGIIN